METNSIINELREKTKSDPDLSNAIECSLAMAKRIGHEELDPKNYQLVTWPTTIEDYLDYLTTFLRYIPHQAEDVVHNEVKIFLDHFYWLIGQPLEGDQRPLRDFPWMNQWIVKYLDVWGNFLNTAESFNQDIVESFKFSKEYCIQDSMFEGKPNNPSGWLTFNQFFARTLNAGLRPIDSPFDNHIVTSPCDGYYKSSYQIDADSKIPEITLKGTHKFTTIPTLLEGSKYCDSFANGKFVHYYLAPYSYHRYHIPVSGKVMEVHKVKGSAALTVKIEDKQFATIDDATTGYEFIQTRGYVTIDTTASEYGNVGIVAVIPVGMGHVSSVNLPVTPGCELLKGDEFGYFLFGGSDCILLFQEGIDVEIDTSRDYKHYGQMVARCK
jgi:phosphatidylserine decarboxylase